MQQAINVRDKKAQGKGYIYSFQYFQEFLHLLRFIILY